MKKKARLNNIQNRQDCQTRVQEMALGAGSLRVSVSDTEGVDIVPPPIVDPVPGGIVANKSGTRSKGPCTNVGILAP